MNTHKRYLFSLDNVSAKSRQFKSVFNANLNKKTFNFMAKNVPINLKTMTIYFAKAIKPQFSAPVVLLTNR